MSEYCDMYLRFVCCIPLNESRMEVKTKLSYFKTTYVLHCGVFPCIYVKDWCNRDPIPRGKNLVSGGATLNGPIKARQRLTVINSSTHGTSRSL